MIMSIRLISVAAAKLIQFVIYTNYRSRQYQELCDGHADASGDIMVRMNGHTCESKYYCYTE